LYAADDIHDVKSVRHKGRELMKLLLVVALLAMALASADSQNLEAPTGFDNKSNGLVDDTTHRADQDKFDETESVGEGLGPLYNAQSCRECHQNPTSGGTSQITELRVGHQGSDHRFHNPDIPIAHGTEIISGRSLVNDRAICPNAGFATTEIREYVPETESIRTTRVALGLLGDGFVEAVADQTLVELARKQCKDTHHKICGQVLYVPITESPRETGVGRFGWKDQHASLVSFSGDAYLNEMGITTRLFPDEVTKLCNTAPEPNDPPGPDGLDDIDRFARFVRASKAPARDSVLAQTAKAEKGSGLFHKIGCQLSRAHIDYCAGGHKDQWRHIYDSGSARRKNLLSVLRFAFAQRRDGRRIRCVHAGALRAEDVSDPVEEFLAG
jgi:Di-haem oxidoreductase, putative peroxidase